MLVLSTPYQVLRMSTCFGFIALGSGAAGGPCRLFRAVAGMVARGVHVALVMSIDRAAAA